MTSLKAPTSHYYCTRRHFIIARDVRPPKPPLGILSRPISWDLLSEEKFQAILQLQALFTTSIIPSKHAGSIKFGVKRLEKKLFLFPDCGHIGINLIIAILKHKRNRKFYFFSVKSIFISLMNTKSGIFTCGSATHENTTFGVHSVK